MSAETATLSTSAPVQPAETKRPLEPRPFGKDGFTFGDILDVVNPLHHIPVVGTIYRKLTGDDIAALPRVAGGGLFGGVVGLGAALVSTIAKASTGKDLGDNVLTAFATLANGHRTAQAHQAARPDNQISPAPPPASVGAEPARQAESQRGQTADPHRLPPLTAPLSNAVLSNYDWTRETLARLGTHDRNRLDLRA